MGPIAVPHPGAQREPHSVMIAALDVGGTKIALGLVSEDGRVVAQTRFRSQPERSYAASLEAIAAAFTALFRQKNATASGLGIGITGRFDPDGTLHANAFLPNWGGHNVVGDLQALLGLPVALANDADAATLGELMWGAGRGSRRFIYVTVSTGIGGGVVLDGRLQRGRAGEHPEIGHHVVDPTGPPCFCGAHGCWESLASGTALAAWARSQGGGVDWDARRICELAQAGEPLAQQGVAREAYYLGLGLANLITIFVPDCVALGGGVMQQWPLFAGRAQEVIAQNCGLVPWRLTRLAPASSVQNGLAGAAAVWIDARARDWRQ